MSGLIHILKTGGGRKRNSIKKRRRKMEAEGSKKTEAEEKYIFYS